MVIGKNRVTLRSNYATWQRRMKKNSRNDNLYRLACLVLPVSQLRVTTPDRLEMDKKTGQFIALGKKWLSTPCSLETYRENGSYLVFLRQCGIHKWKKML